MPSAGRAPDTASKSNFDADDSCDIMLAIISVGGDSTGMKRTIAVFTSVSLATFGLLTVPVGFVALAFSPTVGVVLTVIGGLVLGLCIVLNRRIDRPPTRRCR